ncbi:MAG: hypothetical protein MI865_10890 [Proteobacteria bacterium]|nr:hypothetical protein [Pseudomonadota bacterium]
MNKIYGLLIILISFSLNLYAIEPQLDHQGMIYFNMTFDAGYSKKTEHDFGFRFDRGYVEPGSNMTVNQLVGKPAIINLKMNNNGLQAFELNGINYSYKDYVFYGAEGGNAKTTDTETTGAKTTGAKTVDTETATVENETITTEEQVVEESELSKRIGEIPLGAWIGAIIGIVALSAGTN